MDNLSGTLDFKLNEWLKQYEPINEIAMIEEIHTERLSSSTNNLALQRTGFENLPLKYITDRGWYRQYNYMLLLKNESEIDEQRLTNLDWLDDFTEWLEKQNKNHNFPIFEDGKVIKEISCANVLTYQENENGSESIYSLQIYVNVRKEEI